MYAFLLYVSTRLDESRGYIATALGHHTSARRLDGGAEIVKYLKTGRAYYAPGAAVAEMVGAILGDRHKILPCAAYLEGEYGVHGLFMGVPCKLGESGIEQSMEIKLTKQEQVEFEKSASAVKELVAAIDAQLVEAFTSLAG